MKHLFLIAIIAQMFCAMQDGNEFFFGVHAALPEQAQRRSDKNWEIFVRIIKVGLENDSDLWYNYHDAVPHAPDGGQKGENSAQASGHLQEEEARNRRPHTRTPNPYEGRIVGDFAIRMACWVIALPLRGIRLHAARSGIDQAAVNLELCQNFR